MRVLFSILLLAPTFAFSMFLLDDVMTREDQKKTGVWYLNHNQKAYLEQWLNDNVVMKTNTMGQNQELSLALNLDQGKRLQLSNGAIYEVHPADLPISQSWLTPFPILVQSSGDPNYPTKLVNKNDGMSVRARMAPAGS